MIRVAAAYALAGVLFAVIAAFTATDRDHPKRWRNTGSWLAIPTGQVFR